MRWRPMTSTADLLAAHLSGEHHMIAYDEGIYGLARLHAERHRAAGSTYHVVLGDYDERPIVRTIAQVIGDASEELE